MRNYFTLTAMAWLVALAAVLAAGTDDKEVTESMCRAGGGHAVAGAVGTPGYCSGGIYNGKPITGRIMGASA
ncbi:hypothetical protein [Nocardia araoensis]|uniref:hypothetical protein n=1 Tax=Nocardia araoensis TaxID=228600 RepID=UPI0012F63B6B|nr:hypothetical protein [Nocardia araoensis]